MDLQRYNKLLATLFLRVFLFGVSDFLSVCFYRVVKSSRSLDLNSQLSIEADESLKCDSLEVFFPYPLIFPSH